VKAGFAMSSLANSILLFQTFLRKSSKDLNGELLARAATIAEAEWSEARIVADGKHLAVNDAVGCAKATIVDRGFPPILHIERSSLEGASSKSHLVAFRIVYFMARRRVVVAIRLKLSGSFHCTGSKLVVSCGVTI